MHEAFKERYKGDNGEGTREKKEADSIGVIEDMRTVYTEKLDFEDIETVPQMLGIDSAEKSDDSIKSIDDDEFGTGELN